MLGAGSRPECAGVERFGRCCTSLSISQFAEKMTHPNNTRLTPRCEFPVPIVASTTADHVSVVEKQKWALNFKVSGEGKFFSAIPIL